MGCYRCDSEEEWFIAGDSIVEEPEGLFSDYLNGMLTLVASWRVLVPLVVRTKVLVCVRVEEEVGGVEARHERGVVVVHGVSVEEFPCVVGGVAGCLEPEGEPVLVVAFGDEFGVSSCSFLLVFLAIGCWGRVEGHTVWGIDLGHVGVVRLLAGPETHS